MADIRHDAEELLRAAFLAGSLHGNAPVVICGDMNMAPEDSQVWDQAIQSGKWHDAITSFSHLPDTDQRIHGPVSIHFPTMEKWIAKVDGARIDRIFINSAALRILKDAWTVPLRPRRSPSSWSRI